MDSIWRGAYHLWAAEQNSPTKKDGLTLMDVSKTEITDMKGNPVDIFPESKVIEFKTFNHSSPSSYQSLNTYTESQILSAIAAGNTKDIPSNVLKRYTEIASYGPHVRVSLDEEQAKPITEYNSEYLDELSKVMEKGLDEKNGTLKNVDNVLAQLGKLDADTKSFNVQSENYQDFAYLGRGDGKYETGITFSMTTAEGDKITISLGTGKGEGLTQFHTDLSYQVEGDLSDEEMEALNQLYEHIGEFAGDLFEGGFTANLAQGLDLSEAFDSDVLTSFAINAHNGRTGHDRERLVNYFDYEYEIDKANGEQTLSIDARETNPFFALQPQKFNFTLTTELNGQYDEQQILQYQHMIAENLSAFGFQQENHPNLHNFLTESFGSLFEVKDIKNDVAEREKANKDVAKENARFERESGQENVIEQDQQQLSLLADFSFRLSFGDFNAKPDSSWYEKFRANNGLMTLKQQTDVDKTGRGDKVTQEKTSSLHAERFDNERDDMRLRLDRISQRQSEVLSVLTSPDGELLELDHQFQTKTWMRREDMFSGNLIQKHNTKDEFEKSTNLKLIDGVLQKVQDRNQSHWEKESLEDGAQFYFPEYAGINIKV